MSMPAEIALGDIMKSLKFMKSIEIYRYPPIPTRPLVMYTVSRKKAINMEFSCQNIFFMPETTRKQLTTPAMTIQTTTTVPIRQN